jgi:hypothetical protein
VAPGASAVPHALHAGPLFLDEPVEQWFSVLQRKRLVAPNFANLQELEDKLLAFIDEWNQDAHPFRWTAKSFEKILAQCDSNLAAA